MSNDHGRLIDPSKFPARSVDLDVARIEQSAGELGRLGRAIEDRTLQADASWSRLTTCYSAPEQERVYRLMAPAVTSAGSARAAFVRASEHLDAYASTLAALKPRLAAFEKRADAFRAKVADGVWVDASSAKGASFGDHVAWAFDWVPGVDERRVKVPWDEDGHTVAKNADLLDEYAGLLAEVSAAASACANAVNALVRGVVLDPVEAIPAAAFTAADGGPMPWGGPGLEDRNCRESVGHGGYEFGKNLVQGLGSLVLGYNPATGDFWDGSTYGQTWTGLGDLAGSLALLTSPFTLPFALGGSFAASAGWSNDPYSSFMQDRTATVTGALGSLIGYDAAAKDGWHKWHEDGWATGTESVLNVGTFFIPGVGEAGGALKGASAAVKVTRLAEVGADFAFQGGSWAVRGGVRVVTGLRDALLRVHLDDLSGTVRAGEVLDASTGARLNPTALLNAVADVPTTRPLSEHLGLDAAEPVRATTRGTTDLGQGEHAPAGHDVPAQHGGREVAGAEPTTPGDGRHVPGPQDSSTLDPAGLHVNDQEVSVAQDPPGQDSEGVSDRTPPEQYPRPEPQHDVTVKAGERGFPGPRTPFATRTDLAPNTTYHVEGRGDFHTNEHGNVTYVETTYGGTGKLNADLQNPQDGATYVVYADGDAQFSPHVFEIGPGGRTDVAYVEHLALGDADRSPSVQARIGGEGGVGYDGGHLLARMFGGGGEDINILPMLEEVNRAGSGTFYELEQQWRSLIGQIPPVDVSVTIEPDYVGPGRVPESFFVEWTENGDLKGRVFRNVS